MIKKLRDLVEKILKWRYLRFLIVGTIGTLISMSILYSLTEFFHVYYIVSFLIGTIAGSINNYLMSKYWVFTQ